MRKAAESEAQEARHDSTREIPLRRISTSRRTLVAGTVESARAEVRRLGGDPTAVGWASWSVLLDAGPAERSPHLIGKGGFLGRPAPDGTVEIGSSIPWTQQRRGYAPEAGTIQFERRREL